MGLAHRLWKEIEYPFVVDMAKAFDMSSVDAAADIFTGMGETLEDEQNITPENVADAIDLYLAKQKVGL